MTKEMKQLGVAIQLATIAHSGQYDKSGKPYILHPLHLMSELMYDTELAIIAVLHDVVEDSEFTLEDLKYYGMSERVLAALKLLTHNKDQSYDDYITEIASSQDAITVKRKRLRT